MAATCVRLGFWQLDRLHGRKDANAAIAAAEAIPPRPLPDLLAGTGDPTSLRFRPAVATGTYDPAHEVLLYGRASREGQSGDQVLTPLRLADGTAIVVDRGWIPIDQDVPVTGEAAAPTGTVTVAGELFPADAISSGPPATDRITTVDLGRIGATLPYPILPVYLLLERQDPPQPGALPELPPLPPLTNGPHLSYAVQWFSFAAIALIGYVILLRRDRREAVAPVGSVPGEET